MDNLPFKINPQENVVKFEKEMFEHFVVKADMFGKILSYRLIQFLLKVQKAPRKRLQKITANYMCDSIDGWNPEPPEMYETL